LENIEENSEKIGKISLSLSLALSHTHSLAMATSHEWRVSVDRLELTVTKNSYNRIIKLFQNKFNGSLELVAASLECTLYHDGSIVLFLECLKYSYNITGKK
jgi:hypothetical protein